MPRKTTSPNAILREKRNTRALIGQRLARRRAAMGMSQTVLAVKFGVSRAALSQYEVGIGDLNAGDMNSLAEILKVPVTYFYLDQVDAEKQERMHDLLALIDDSAKLHDLGQSHDLDRHSLATSEQGR